MNYFLVVDGSNMVLVELEDGSKYLSPSKYLRTSEDGSMYLTLPTPGHDDEFLDEYYDEEEDDEDANGDLESDEMYWYYPGTHVGSYELEELGQLSQPPVAPRRGGGGNKSLKKRQAWVYILFKYLNLY